MELVFSFVFDVADELGIEDCVLISISVHTSQHAECTPQDQDKDDWNPDKGLCCHEIARRLSC